MKTSWLALAAIVVGWGCNVHVDGRSPGSPDAAPERPGDGSADRDGGFASDSLRAYVSDDLPFVGASVRTAPLEEEEPYREVLAREFNIVTPENAIKWSFIHPQPGTYAYDDADAIIAFAEEAGQALRGHALVWHNSLPDWVADLEPTELREVMLQHIAEVVGRYAGRIAHWDVVNEAIADDGTMRESPFLDKLGASYVREAFDAARAADPDALLFYNDAFLFYNGASFAGRTPKAEAVYELLRDLIQNGAPIDGIGIQAHIDAYSFLTGFQTEARLRDYIQRFGELGLRVYFSEVDVRIARIALNEEQRLDVQREVYHRLADICRSEPACDGIVLWGFTDKHSWIDTHVWPDDPLLFDESYAKKPAYHGLAAGMRGEPSAGYPALDSLCGPEPDAGVLFCEPFEHDRTGHLFAVQREGGTVDALEDGYRGTGALRASIPGEGSTAFGVRHVIPEVQSGPLYARAYVHVPATSAIEGFGLFGVASGSPPYEGMTVALSSGGALQLSATTAGAYPTSGAYQLPLDQWSCIELRVDAADAGGEASVSVDGVERITLSGDTRPSPGYQNVLAGIAYTLADQGPAEVRIDELVVSRDPIGCDP